MLIRIWDNQKQKYETIEDVKYIANKTYFGDGVFGTKIELMVNGIRLTKKYELPRYELEFIHGEDFN